MKIYIAIGIYFFFLSVSSASAHKSSRHHIFQYACICTRVYVYLYQVRLCVCIIMYTCVLCVGCLCVFFWSFGRFLVEIINATTKCTRDRGKNVNNAIGTDIYIVLSSLGPVRAFGLVIVVGSQYLNTRTENT